MSKVKANFLIFAPIVSGNFYEKLCASFVDFGHQVSGYISDDKLNSSSLIVDAKWINCKFLYRKETVKDAVDIDAPIMSYGEYSQAVKDGERYFLLNSDRLSAIPNSVEYRICHYQQLVSLYSAILKKWQITHIFFANVPHLCVDLALYYVAKDLNVDVIIPSRTDYQDIFILRDDLQSSPVHLNGCNLNFLKKHTDSKSFYVRHSNKLNALSINFNGRFSKFYVLNTVLILLKFIMLFFDFCLIKKRDSSSLYCCPKLSAIKLFGLYVKRYIQNRRMYESYARLSHEPSFVHPYIYFALHFQPERSTLPEGGSFVDQIAAVQLLSRAMPPGWKIYVKEHPRQFDSWPPDLRKLHARTSDFYQIISGIHGVELISVDVDSEKLIRSSRISATITGSSGWLAMLAGVPSITFGKTWYSDASACRVVDDLEGARVAITEMSMYSNSDVALAVQSFLTNLNQYVFLGYNKLSRDNYSESDIQKRVEEFLGAINAFINR